MVNHDFDRSAAFAHKDRECSLAVGYKAEHSGGAIGAPRESLVGRIEQTASASAEVAARVNIVAGRLVGFYPPKETGAEKVQPMPDNSAARIEYADLVIRRSGAEILRALEAIEAALS